MCWLRPFWHGLCPMASIHPFAWPLLTVACRQCLHPCVMTTHLRTFNLAKCALFVLYHEWQTPVFVLLHPYLAKHELEFLLPLQHILVKFICAPLPLWPNMCLWIYGASLACESLDFVCAPLFLWPNTCLWVCGASPACCSCPLISSAEHMIWVCSWLLILHEPSAVVCAPFISGSLLSLCLVTNPFLCHPFFWAWGTWLN